MQPTELYRYFDAEGTLLYIGISIEWSRRDGQHRHQAPWRDRVASVTVERYPTRRQALDAEAAAIKMERPVHNVVHAKPATPPACGRTAINRRAAAARRRVLATFQREQPATYERWLTEAYEDYDRRENDQ